MLNTWLASFMTQYSFKIMKHKPQILQPTKNFPQCKIDKCLITSLLTEYAHFTFKKPLWLVTLFLLPQVFRESWYSLFFGSMNESSIKLPILHKKCRIWSHSLKKSLMENFIFCAVLRTRFDVMASRLDFNNFMLLISFYNKYNHYKTRGLQAESYV